MTVEQQKLVARYRKPLRNMYMWKRFGKNKWQLEIALSKAWGKYKVGTRLGIYHVKEAINYPI